MTKVNRDNYFLVQGWMVEDLELKSGIERDLYAIIYGFSQAENQCFNGSIQYLADWCSSSRQAVITALKKLVDKGLIIKNEKYVNGVKFVEYQSRKLTRGSQESLMGVVKKVDWGSQESLPNNIDNNIINNINNNNEPSIFEFIESNFGRTLNPIEIEKIREWEDSELTRYAIKKSVLNGKYVINYIDRIIKNWQVEGIKTVAQAQETKQQVSKEPIWFDKEIKEQEATDIEKQEIEDILAEFR